jgi:hypothetical protein
LTPKLCGYNPEAATNSFLPGDAYPMPEHHDIEACTLGLVATSGGIGMAFTLEYILSDALYSCSYVPSCQAPKTATS